MEIEYVEVEGYKGSIVDRFKAPLVHFPKMKMKDIIRNYFGSNFEDEDSNESYVLYAMQDFHKWYVEQSNLVKGKACK